MPIVVGVKFDNTPKVYWFSAGEFEYTEGCRVIVETARGVEIGTVKTMPKEVEESKIVSPLKDVLRIATKDDLDRQKEYDEKRPEAIRIASEKISARGLKMKVVDAQYTIDGAKLVLYFTAESRVDFRELVKDLASAFRTRIELRQMGSRDECRMIGGLAPCGRACCCSAGLDFSKVNIKMAKNQNLSLNPAKISGMCGRLMCCLSYENAHYAETNKLMPKMGSKVKVTTEESSFTGTVVGINQIKMTVNVKNEIKDGSFEIKEYPLESVTKLDSSSAADDLVVSKAEAAELGGMED